MKFFIPLIILLTLINISSASEFSLSNTNEYAPSLRNRFGIVATANPNPSKLASVNTVSVSYATKLTNYWLDFNLNASSGMFQKMTMNNTLATSLSDIDLYDARSTHTSIGVGFMLESKYAQELFNSDSLFETSSAHLTYNLFKTAPLSSTFTGPGLMTKFALCKKFSNVFSMGANINYHLASVKRSSNSDNEISSAQSLTVSYITLGLELILTL